MASILSCSINLSKIDKSKIVLGKDGITKYFNFDIIVNDDFDKYNNNVQITDKQTKEQREAKEKKNFLGNGRVVWSSQGKVEKKETPAPAQTKEEFRVADDPDGDDLPFLYVFFHHH